MWLGICRTVTILAVLGYLMTVATLPDKKEIYCPSDTFQCKDEISPGSYCIPKNWVCDTDEDCPGGEDEKANCSIPTCPSNQFACKRGAARCVPNGWTCDGENDCDDGSDEHIETCKKYKKKQLRGFSVNTFKCLPNMYQCPGTRKCIHLSQVCDGKVDCFEDRADEGFHCSNSGCKNTCKKTKCRETLQGPQCYCDKGLMLNEQNICVDLDECEYDVFCDQKCTNAPSSYECNCVDGYSKKDLKNPTDGTCIADGDKYLLLANTFNVQKISINGEQLLKPYLANGSHIETLDFDFHNNSFCWINTVKTSQSSLLCAKLDDPNINWSLLTHHKLNSVEHIARDWIGDNWYFADDVKENIFLCGGDGKHCVNIINIGIKRPKSLAVDPSRGLLFYADWSMDAKIERTDMDGSNKLTLVSKKIVHPNGLTLDYANKHVYWADSFLNFIERVDYNGNKRRIIAEGSNVEHVHGMTIFENYLYVTNHHNNSVVKVHRYNEGDIKVVNQYPLEKPVDIHVIHPVKQPGDKNVCIKKKCDHICVPVPHNSSSIISTYITARCLCRDGYILVNSTVCQKNSFDTFLMYANAQQGNIQGISLGLTQAYSVIEPIIDLNRPIAIAFDSEEEYIYYSDVSLLRIGRRKVQSDKEPEVFLDAGVTSSEGLAIDWLGRNLYWTDDGHKTINVVRLDNTSIKQTVITDLNHPKAIVLDPNEGYMYWTDWVLKPSQITSKIEKANMDGSERITLVDTDIQWPNSLTIDYNTQTLYWTDAYYDRIESISTSGDKATRKIIISYNRSNHPYGIAVYNDILYWTESLSGQIHAKNLSGGDSVVVRNDSSPLFDLKLYDPQLHHVKDPEKDCAKNNGDCEEICISVPDGHVCTCAIGRQLMPDGKHCEGIANFTTPAPCNLEREFECGDGSCINREWLCDNEQDCLDGADENFGVGGACSNLKCPDDTFPCENSTCIPLHLRCDGNNDCLHGDDEKKCGRGNCTNANYTACGGNSTRCIPNSWVCDKEIDCPDGSDEKKECETAECVEDQFKCGHGHCIPYSYKCDNEYDCPDHSDELDCTYWCDPALEFKCLDRSRCINKNLLCDGSFDCPDNSDELNCNKSSSFCHDKEFTCSNGECITKLWQCDGDTDCFDKSDELNCPTNRTVECQSKEKKCLDDSKCIPLKWWCDGDNDCDDHSDEHLCDKNCQYPNFSCDNKSICLTPDHYCDSKADCLDSTDENRSRCLLNFCGAHECSHKCHETPFGYVCSCPDNMIMTSDNKTCKAEKACSKWGVCSQGCITVPTGHRCNCSEGYTLQEDDYRCKPNVEPVYVIYSNRHEIRRVDLNEMSYVSLVAGLHNTIAVDYHYVKNYVFWTDVVDDKLYRGKMIHNTMTDIKPIINVGLATTEGLAVDWIAEKIYWVESNLDQIEVADFDGKLRLTLIAGNMTSPRAIAVDPRNGSLFWSDWDGQNPRIETCSMSGENRRVLFGVRSIFYQGGWPNGITLDYEENRLYWVDARSDSLHTISYEGTDHRLILKSHEYLAQPFSISVFEHYVYWTDWRTNSLMRANKFNGSDITEIQKTYTQPFDLHVFHPYRQPKAHNPCEINNGGCSHLCLIGYAKIPGGMTTADCKCPHRMKITADGKRCEDDNTFLIFVKKNEIRGVDLDNPNYNVIPSITVRYGENATTRPTAIDYDEERLYWTDVSRNVINSAYLNGSSGVETIIDSGVEEIQGFAIDYLANNMYFSSYNAKHHISTISVAKLNGAFRTEIITETEKEKILKLNSLAIYPDKGLMFWSDIGGTQHKIIQANMDGSERRIIVPNVTNPSSLSIDTNTNRLYWISQGQIIHHCSIGKNGNIETCEETNVGFKVVSMTIHKNEIYVSNATNIVRINPKTYEQHVMHKDTPDITAMQVYNKQRGLLVENSCSKKNGGCSQLCLPRFNSRVCKCTAGFQLTQDGTSCQGITSFILYATDSHIEGISVRDPQQVALASISKITLATAIDFHSEQDYIYWVDSNARVISRIKRDLTQREEIIKEGLNGVEGLAIDWIANNIYWTDRSHNVVEVSRMNGSNRYVILHEGLDDPTSIVVHPLKGTLYFVDMGKVPCILQAKMDGSELKTLIDTDIESPQGLALDYQEDVLYWCDQSRKTLYSYNLNTEQRTEVVKDIHKCVSVTVFGQHIYWAESSEQQGIIKRANKNTGEGVQIVKTDLSNKLKDVKIFDSERQTGTNICDGNQFGCAELCLYRGASDASCVCSYGRLLDDGRNCVEYTSFLMFSEVTAIGSAHMINKVNLNHPYKEIKNDSVMRNVIGIAYDYKNKLIFYSDIQRGDIQSVYFNGTGFDVVMTGVGSVEGLVFDSVTSDLYLTSYTNSSISKISLSVTDKKLETLIQLSQMDHPRAIVLHSCQSRIFWTNWNNDKPSIQRAFLDGKKVESLITERIETPNGLALDYKADKLYWSDARLDKIERCDLDGNNRMVIVTSIPQHSFGLAVYGNYLYWTDWMLRAVLQANKYDGSEITWLKKNIRRQPMGIVAIAEDAANCTLSPCYNNMYGCDGDCYITDKGLPKCKCPKGKFLLQDGRSCAVDKNLNCNATDFVCDDRMMCVPVEKTCNGIGDCADASDESITFCKDRKCPADYFTCNNSRCVGLSKLCNGLNDCGDNTDEKECPCGEDEFKCDNGLCILKKYRCDRDIDCMDHSDEIGCNLNCSDVEMDGEHVPGLVSCNTTSACIFLGWICDGTNDCWDNNDEKNCSSEEGEKCPKSAFKCANGSSCIPPQWQCDKDYDCADMSDEANCKYTCNEKDQFACNDSTCVPKTWECDGHPDCPDQSDEHDNCSNKTCKEDEMKCSTGKCIPNAWKCDGDSDCDDGMDETHHDCPKIWCQENEFSCANGKCIPETFYCDRDDDCGDNSDEKSCFYPSCSSDQFKCGKSERCINTTQRCDGLFDCPDHSDEANCTAAQPCGGDDSLFLCSNELCINNDLVCDGNDDCGDDSDEPDNCGVNECLGQHKCMAICKDKKIGYECQCPTGFQLKNDTHSCEDINECETTYPCSHYCQNVIGSYHCRCAKGYTMTPDHHMCKADVRPTLIVSNRYYIINISVPVGNLSILNQNLTNAVAMDIDWKEQYIYWSDITSRSSSINRMKITDKSADTEVLHSSTVRNPDGLAVDWVGRNLYWCDKTTDTIEVSKLEGRYRRVLLRHGLQEPRGLEVFPSKGVLFYTDWGDSPHIGRMWMDGSRSQVIVKDNLGWPNALTIDYVTERIIWADGSLDYIAMAKLDGSDRRIIVGDSVRVPHVFDLATFENYIYWTDWEHMGIFYANKFTGENATLLTNFVHKPMGLQVYHRLRQVQPSVNPCDNHECSHLCLLRPHKGNMDELEAVCSCPENFHISKDNQNCVSNCTSGQFLCKESSKCIPFWWKCDGHIDCEDGSDEPPECEEYHCLITGLFQCADAKGPEDCHPPGMICDGTAQCQDGSDEKNCESYPCLDHHFKCTADNICIPELLKCDKNKTCSDGADELNCPETTCNPNQFSCANGRCVPYVWRCDNDDDCGDWSDEPDNCRNVTCKDDHIKCKMTGRCIPKAWQCDGDRDCGENDDTDEDTEKCHQITCDSTYFACNNGHCIPGRWKCDDYDDCRDGSDEVNCAPRNCSESEWKCNIGKCINKKLRCNKEINCEDGSDEVDCDNITCNDDEFMCQKIKHCIPSYWKCDGDTDCVDGTDEWNCARNCTEHEFQCDNTMCKSALWQCDGDDDCGDNSDEDPERCKDYACTPGRFRCNSSNICIWYNMVCDGQVHCKDGEDEGEICEQKESCDVGDFRCHSTKNSRSKQCVSVDKLCDGKDDCKDGSDELSAVCKSANKSCDIYNGGCDQHCKETNGRIQCGCERGFHLNKNGYSCSRVNPCEEFGVCSQRCETNKDNLQVKYHCYCEEGYKRVADACLAEGDPPTLLLAEEEKVIRTPLFNQNSQNIRPTILAENEETNNDHIIAMDVDVSGETWKAFTVVLSRNHTWIVSSIKIPKKNPAKRQKREAREVLFTSFADIRGLTVDWVRKRIYWTEGLTHAIKVANYKDGSRNNTIVVVNPEDPQDIIVHPKNRQLFWTDQGIKPKIERSNLDGTNRTILVDTDIIWPNGLAVDYANDRLYWADTKKYTIESVDLNGEDRRVIHTLNASDPPYKLEVFENFIYVLTYRNFSVLRLHKFQGQQQVIKKLYMSAEKVRELVVVQEHKQQQLPDNCSSNPCVETQMCFNDWSNQGYSCKCPDNSVLKDKKCDFVPNVNTCTPNYCQNNGTCTQNFHQKPKCSCPPLFEGDRCDIDKCDNYCIIGRCIESEKNPGEPECRCHEGYTGERCDQYVCTGYCKNKGKCSVKDGKPYCLCSYAFTGDRCEKNVEDPCHQCENDAECITEESGFITCKCKDNFIGQNCDQCGELHCYNGGTCHRHSNKTAFCVCPPGLAPERNCEYPSCIDICKSNVVDKGACHCPCVGAEPGAGCTCKDLNCNHGNCTLDNQVPKCQCPDVFSGPNCDVCQCQPEGHCMIDNNRAFCRCNEGYVGKFCKTSTVAQPKKGSLNPVTIVVPIVVSFIVIIIIIAIIIYRRRKRWQQYRHKRMQEPRNLDVNNPIYLQNDEEIDDPLESSPIYTGNKNTNFSSPMYDVYNGESMSMLLQNRENEDNQILEDGLTVRYYNNGEVSTNNNTTSKA